MAPLLLLFVGFSHGGYGMDNVISGPSPESATRPAFLERHRLKNLILEPTGDRNEFDGLAVECPKVFYFKDRWYMVYTGLTTREGQTVHSIGLAQSADLLRWRRLREILKPAGGSTFDGACVSAPFPYVEDGTVHLFYAGFPEKGYEGGQSLIGSATSQDLVDWHRNPRNPLITTGPAGSWNDTKLYQSFVMRHEGVYYLYYNAYGTATHSEQIGLATSTDLLNWHPHPDSPLLRQGDETVTRDNKIIGDPWIVQIDDLWWMFYFGFDGVHARDNVAISSDLVHWTKRTEWNPVLDAGPPGSYDEIHAHKPCLILHGGIWYHFYTAVGKKPSGAHYRAIALATSQRLPDVEYRE